MYICAMEIKKYRGGAGLGQGRKKLPSTEKKQPLTIYIQGEKIIKLGGKAKVLKLATDYINDKADSV